MSEETPLYEPDPRWVGCEASPAAIQLLFEAGVSYPKLVVMARMYGPTDVFVKAVLEVAAEADSELPAKLARLDLIMIYDHVLAKAPAGQQHADKIGQAAVSSPVPPVGTPPTFRRDEVAERVARSLVTTPQPLVQPVALTAEDRESAEGTLAVIRDANLLGVSALSVLKSHVGDGCEDEVMVKDAEALVRKAIAKRAADGGAVLKAVRGGEVKFTAHIEELCRYLSEREPPLMYAVARIRICVTQAPAWKAGAAEYWEKYFTRHGFVFPVRFDQLLQHQAQNSAIKDLVSKLGDVSKIDRASAQMDGISAQLAACCPIDGDGVMGLADGGISFRGKCNRCLEDGHTVKDCPHTAEVATKLRAAFVNGRACERRKPSNQFDSGADSN